MPGWSRDLDWSACNTDHAVGPGVGKDRRVLVNGRKVLCMSDVGSYPACCGATAVVWVASEGSTTVFVDGLHAATKGCATAHQAGKGTLAEGSADVLIGGPTITMEELARADALALLDKGEAALTRWDAKDRQHFKTWFGTDADWARRTLLDRTREMRRRITNAHLEQDDGGGYGQNWRFTNTIQLEQLFWTAPRTGTDSRAGTVIHEASHFWGSGLTGDFEYGPGDCQQLARDNPALAIDNADNTSYYFEHL